jgi:uncharacterized SAM-binding protein YcdF (DUF218 family)
MFELLTRILLWAFIFGILWYIFSQFIPRVYLTWLGGLLVAAFIILSFLDPTDRTVSVVWNLLSLPLQPLGLTIVLLLSSLRGGVNKTTGNAVLAALLILLISSTPVVAYWLTNQTQQTVFSSLSAAGDRTADPATVRAIVILGDNADPGGSAYRTRTQLNAAEAGFSTALTPRLIFASELYGTQVDQGNNPLVIVSLGPQLDASAVNEAQAVTDFLVSRGVPAERVLIESTGVNLRSVGVEVNRLLRDRGFAQGDTTILVASAINIRRAGSTFAQLGLDPILRPTDLYSFQIQPPPDEELLVLEDLVPNVDALALTTRVVEEYLASIYYFLRGWLVNPLLF